MNGEEVARRNTSKVFVLFVLNFLAWGGAAAFCVYLWNFAGRAANCGPRIGVPCQSGTAFGLVGVWISVAAMLVLLAYLWRDGVRGPMPAAAAPGLLGAVLGARFLWSALFIAEGAGSRAVMAVVGVLLAGVLGGLYGSWLLRRWGTDLLIRGARIDHGGVILPRGPVESRARDVRLAVSLVGALAGCVAGVLPA